MPALFYFGLQWFVVAYGWSVYGDDIISDGWRFIVPNVLIGLCGVGQAYRGKWI